MQYLGIDINEEWDPREIKNRIEKVRTAFIKMNWLFSSHIDAMFSPSSFTMAKLEPLPKQHSNASKHLRCICIVGWNTRKTWNPSPKKGISWLKNLRKWFNTNKCITFPLSSKVNLSERKRGIYCFTIQKCHI